MACTPGKSCCCCVPCCFGLRAGVLLLAILQILGGSISAIAMATVLIDAAINELKYYTEYYVQCGLYLVWNLIIIATGITGVRATCSLEMVKNIDVAIVKRAKTYWRASVFVTIVYFLVGLANAILETHFVFGNLSITQEERALSLALIWLACLIGVSIQAYFLWVVWSYKARVQRASEGTLEGAYVVKGMFFQLGMKSGALSAQQTYTAYNV